MWESTKFFFKQVLQHFTDAEINNMLLCELFNSILNKKLDLVYLKLQKLIAIYKDHLTMFNHYFQENVVVLQKVCHNPSIEQKLHKIFSQWITVSKQDILLLISTMQIKGMLNMNCKITKKIFNYMNIFYKICALLFLQCF